MEQFYFIVLVSASVILILLLTFIGTLLYTSTSTAPFPPTANICPDYWQITSNKTCKIPSPGARNPFTYLSSLPSEQQPVGLNGTSIDFGHADWSRKYSGMTALCAKKKWAEANRITWDGITNSSSC